MRANRRSPTTVDGTSAQKTANGRRVVIYPESDGKPMGETELHIDELIRLLQILRRRYRDDPLVYVGGDLIIYYEEGNARAQVVPDVFVAKGARKLPRRDTYLLWQEHVPPTVIIEVTSRSTSREDRTKKWALYARLGVQEYILYDPRFPGLQTRYPPLQGFRLGEQGYEPMAVDADGALLSEALDVRMLLQDGRLELFDRQTAAKLISEAEWAEAATERADAEAGRADAEAEARRAAEERAAAEAAARLQLEQRLTALLRERDERTEGGPPAR